MHFSPANFLLFFLFLHKKCPQKKHTRERRNTLRTTHRKTLLFLSLRNNNINTPRTKTQKRKLSFSLSFFFSLCFQRESFIYTPLSALKKKREREIALKIHLSEKREFEILNIRFCARERELRSHIIAIKKEANKCRTRKKRPRRKR